MPCKLRIFENMPQGRKCLLPPFCNIMCPSSSKTDMKKRSREQNLLILSTLKVRLLHQKCWRGRANMKTVRYSCFTSHFRNGKMSHCSFQNTALHWTWNATPQFYSRNEVCFIRLERQFRSSYACQSTNSGLNALLPLCEKTCKNWNSKMRIYLLTQRWIPLSVMCVCLRHSEVAEQNLKTLFT